MASSQDYGEFRQSGLTELLNQSCPCCGGNTDAKPPRVIDDWLHDYEMFSSESLMRLKKYMEEKR